MDGCTIFHHYHAALNQVGTLTNEGTIQSGNSEAIQDFLRVLDEYPEQLVPINRNSAVVRALRNAAGGNSAQPVTVPDESWRIEAEKQAEIYGQSFVVFRNGEQPQCADPTKVVISFTDKGLGHNADQDVA